MFQLCWSNLNTSIMPYTCEMREIKAKKSVTTLVNCYDLHSKLNSVPTQLRKIYNCR